MPNKFFIGVDEAGYGPNLGPLVVAASLWSAPVDFSEQMFSELLAANFPPRNWTVGCDHVPLGDSKRLYQPAAGLATLEAGLLAMLVPADEQLTTLGELLARVTSKELVDSLLPACYAGFDRLPIPTALPNWDEIRRLNSLAVAKLARCELQLVDLRAAVVTEPQFNAAVAASGSKGHLLSQTTLALVARLLEQCDAEVEIFCDRQGGRKNYLPCLFDAMPQEWFTETAVSNARSSYHNRGPRSVSIHFSVAGDSFPATALASMLAKYLRERLMEQLNAFWRQHLPTLKPTAGYPADAQRFRHEIEGMATQLALPEESWWRIK